MLDNGEGEGLYIVLLSLHGLLRGQNMELGRDADTGGQIKYVVELAQALGRHPKVWRVDLMTRQIVDPAVSPDYAEPHEQLGERAHIIRIPFAPKRYIRKERLWPYLDCFVDRALAHFRGVGRVPDLLHGHYADAGMVGAKLAALLGAPLVFTGHSLGHEKRRRLLESGLKPEFIESRYHMEQRIEAEETALAGATLVVASTSQEAEQQYAAYENYDKRGTAVIPPGVDLERFRPPRRGDPVPPIKAQVDRFLDNPRKPWVLALSRPDERKNIKTLVHAFGRNQELQKLANLVLIAGSREDIESMDKGARQVMTDVLLLIDRYDLYGRIAYPKRHEADEVPQLYRLAAASGGVFVNPALTEPFGLTLLEAAGSGLPVVATNDGGPRDIIAQCRNGLLVDPLDTEGIGEALLDALRDRPRWRRWANNGLKNAHSHYTWESHVETYLKTAARLVQRNRPKRSQPVKTRLTTVDRLLICDIDNTLLGDEAGLQALLARLHEAGGNTAFGVATGRRLDSAVAILKKWGVPMPDILITAVGSEVHYGPSLTEDRAWGRHIDYRWSAERAREALGSLPGFRLQPKSEQRTHKVSFFVERDDLPPLAELRKRIRAAEMQANIIYSHEKYLDLLPVRATKGHAVRYIANRWGISMRRVLVAGDSGNDEEMLTGESLGVVVGNYSRELESLRGKQRVYFAEAPYARGILEGIEHYDFLGAVRQPEEATEPAEAS